MGKAKQKNKYVISDDEAEVVQPIKQATIANNIVDEAVKVGADLFVHTNYLDMKDIPEENGLPHAGYLVLRKSEVVRILYLGSEKTGDEDWLYGEVLKSMPPEIVGRRGWLPSAVVAPKPVVEILHMKTNGDSKPSGDTPSRSSRAGYGSTGPGPPLQIPQKKAQKTRPGMEDRTAPLAAATLADALVVARSGAAPGIRKGGKNARQSPTQESFPALPGHSGNSPCHADEDEEEEPAARPRQRQTTSSEQPPKRDVEGTIARHRALAEAAAAKAQAKAASGKAKGTKSKAEADCPICMEPYSSQRRRAQLPCCGVEMCVQCSERSLRSKRCYFCREEADEFPHLIASAGC
jgi:hypothetical protein